MQSLQHHLFALRLLLECAHMEGAGGMRSLETTCTSAHDLGFAFEIGVGIGSRRTCVIPPFVAVMSPLSWTFFFPSLS